ncbi:hypothetical protein, partial [Photorhabdus thracensis]|uniref:hypothetical protein n=1 Tax=Photorhabdus thracensis TaxID=230089 RepID=UPI001E3D5ADA
EMFKFGFLFIGNEYFHDRYHEPHLGENQAVSMITGIGILLWYILGGRLRLSVSGVLERIEESPK